MRAGDRAALHADEADAAAAAGLGVLRPHPGRVQRQGGVARTSPASSGSTSRSARTSASRAGASRSPIVDEDAKINVNMGAANEIAHIRLAKELMSTMSPIQYDPLFEQRDATGNYQRPPHHLLGDHRLGRPRRAALLVRPDERSVVERGRGRLVPAPAQALPPEERALRLARGAAHGARHHRRLLVDLRRPRSDRTPRSA